MGVASPILATEDVNLVIDGRSISSSPSPLIKNGRTLVPLRVVSEALGAEVKWDEVNRSVHITKGNRSAVLWVDNRLVKYSEGQVSYSLCDVPPMILEDRTFVPLRIVSNLLGVSIKWEGVTRTVQVDSNIPTAFIPFFDAAISSIQPEQTVSGVTELRAVYSASNVTDAAEVRFYLLDPMTGMGNVVAKGTNISGAYRWKPDPSKKGQHVLAAAFYDRTGRFVAGDAVSVNMAVQPQVSLLGIVSGQTAVGTISLSPSLNFKAEYVKYEITNTVKGKVEVTSEIDPYGVYSWTPEMTDNGSASIKVIAYDSTGNSYSSMPVNINVDVERRMELRGISSGYNGEKPVTIWFSRNFLVSEVEYLLKNLQTGQSEILPKTAGQLSSWWFPLPEKAGKWEMRARIRDTVGNIHLTDPVTFVITGTPIVRLETVGPNEVLTGTVKLKAIYNTYLSRIDYYLINTKNGTKKVIAGGSDTTIEYSWTPGQEDNGYWQIQAVGTTVSGSVVYSEAIPVRIYLGKTYSPQPIIEKSMFQDYVSGFALKSYAKTGMSAALQAAQAILETGWGQSSPVDKYTGKLSNNMFGIKGTGSAGSVTSNTWEEYNGNTFRVDAEFRAYQTPEESWSDHKDLLLTKERYGPFREVMHNYIEGAWALKRCGYATDSKYPLKLIDIIKRYELYKLDEVRI
jgi:hypothetical protein